MNGYIQFIANYEDWKAVKKLTIDSKMDNKTILEFLASLTTGVDKKIEYNLGKIVDLSEINSFVERETESRGRSEQAIAAVLSALKGAKLGRIIKQEIEKIKGLQKNEKKEITDFLRAYATRKALKYLGISVDYSEIEIPGLKRLLKKKK